MISIDNVVPPLIGNVFDYLVANLIPRIWYTSPSNSIFIFNRGFIILEEFLLDSLANWFLIFTPKHPKRKGSDPTDEFGGYFDGEAFNDYNGMCSCVRDQRERKFLGDFIINPSKYPKEIHQVFPYEYVHHLGMCMEPSGVSELLSHKPSCHTSIFKKKPNMEVETKSFEKNKKHRRLCLFLSNNFFYVFSALLKTYFTLKWRPLLSYNNIQQEACMNPTSSD